MFHRFNTHAHTHKPTTAATHTPQIAVVLYLVGVDSHDLVDGCAAKRAEASVAKERDTCPQRTDSKKKRQRGKQGVFKKETEGRTRHKKKGKG